MYTVKYSSFSNSRANKCNHSNPTTAIIKLKQHLMTLYLLSKFGADWLIIVDARVYTESNIAVFQIQGQITAVILIRLQP